MADNSERSFSSARNRSNYRSNGREGDILEAFECLHDWYGCSEAGVGAIGEKDVYKYVEASVGTDWAETV